jgi:hypothetical protein
MSAKWTYERTGQLSKARREGDEDGQARLILPPDLYAQYRAEKVASQTGGSAARDSSGEDSIKEWLLHYLNQGVDSALLMLEKGFSFGRFRRPVSVPLLHSIADSMTENLRRLDDRKIEAVGDILNCDQITVEKKIEWALRVIRLSVSGYDVKELSDLLSSIRGFDVSCEAALCDLRDEIQSQI